MSELAAIEDRAPETPVHCTPARPNGDSVAIRIGNSYVPLKSEGKVLIMSIMFTLLYMSRPVDKPASLRTVEGRFAMF